MTPPSAGHASLLMGRPPDKLVMMETYPLLELYLFRNPNFFQVLGSVTVSEGLEAGDGRA